MNTATPAGFIVSDSRCVALRCEDIVHTEDKLVVAGADGQGSVGGEGGGATRGVLVMLERFSIFSMVVDTQIYPGDKMV